MTPRKIRLLGTALAALVLVPLALDAVPAEAQRYERGGDRDSDRGSWRNRDRSPQADNPGRRDRRPGSEDRGDRHRELAGTPPPRREARDAPDRGPRRPERDFRPDRRPPPQVNPGVPAERRAFDPGRREDVRDRRDSWRDRRDTVANPPRDIVQTQHRDRRDPRWDRDGRWDDDRQRDPRWNDRDRRDPRWNNDRRRDNRWDHDRRDRRWDNRDDRRRWEYARRRHDFYHDRARREAQLRWIHHMNTGWSSSRYYGHWGSSDRWRYHRTYYNHGYDRRRFAYYDGICRYDGNGEGAVVGALLGALVGGAAANDDSVGAGILIGAGFGAVLGSSLSRIDNCDRAQYHYAMNHAFEYGQPYYWANPYSGVRGTVVIRETYYVQGVECRWGDAEIYMPDGTYNYDRVRMCRDAYGDWQVARHQ